MKRFIEWIWSKLNIRFVVRRADEKECKTEILHYQVRSSHTHTLCGLGINDNNLTTNKITECNCDLCKRLYQSILNIS